MNADQRKKLIKRSRVVFATLGVFFLAIAVWAFLDPLSFPDDAGWSIGAIGLALIVGACFAPDRVILLFAGPMP